MPAALLSKKSGYKPVKLVMSRTEVLQAIADYDGFTPDNDPPGLHDFGCVTVAGEPYFWNIDYLDKSEMKDSADAADASVTVRILEIMSSSDFSAA